MKTLHLYLTRQVLATLLLTVVVFTFVLLLVNVMRDILQLLQASPLLAFEAVALLIPFVVVFALPMGLLTAALLVFGRFSADQELTAARAGGISLVALLAPILGLSFALSGVCTFINLEVAPPCRVAFKKLLFAVGINRASAGLPENTFITDFPGRIVYIRKVNGPLLKDITIYNLEGEKVESYIRAAGGEVHLDRTNNVVNIQLTDAWRVRLLAEGRRVSEPFYATQTQLSYTNKLDLAAEERTKLTDMTFEQLWAELRGLEKRVTAPTPVQKLSADQYREKMREVERERADLTQPVRVQIHRQVAFSFACVGFTLVGIPLGIRAHRRETTAGIAMALVLVLVYYSFFIVGQALETRPEWFPHLILWLPNFIFQAVGIVLLWRANKGVYPV